jgi:hypothetical protein
MPRNVVDGDVSRKWIGHVEASFDFDRDAAPAMEGDWKLAENQINGQPFGIKW